MNQNTGSGTCGHTYVEGWWDRTVWTCHQPKGHKGWHSAQNRTWNDLGELKPQPSKMQRLEQRVKRLEQQ